MSAVAGVAYSVVAFWAPVASASMISEKTPQNIGVLIAWAIALSLPIARPPPALTTWLLCIGPVGAAAGIARTDKALGVGPLTAGVAALAALKNDVLVLGIGIAAISVALGVLIEYNQIGRSKRAVLEGDSAGKPSANAEPQFAGVERFADGVAGSMGAPALRKFI